MALAFFAGIRPNEISRLSWKDIDLQLDEIHANADTSKTSMVRIIHISAILKKWPAPYEVMTVPASRIRKHAKGKLIIFESISIPDQDHFEQKTTCYTRSGSV